MFKRKKIRFFIFGQSRSGSSLLVDIINSHTDIYCDRELLNRNSIKAKDKIRRSIIERFPYFYIKHQINKQHEKVFGFKLLYHQFSTYPLVKPKLFNKEWKIIHIKRKDVFAQTLSGIIAVKTGKYHRYSQDKVDNKTIYIDPQMVLKKLNYRIETTKCEIELLNGLDYLDVVYENDLADSNSWNESMEGVFKYLGVPPIKVSATTLKTDNRTNEERISNYSEILEYLSNSKFSYLLEQKA